MVVINIDLTAIVEPEDKLDEAAFFFEQASREVNRDQFRWLISAFFNAAYSFFETAALHACHAYTNSDGDTEPDEQALAVLRKYVTVKPEKKKPYFIKTSGVHTITKQLYDLRKQHTHHAPVPIMAAGPSLPQDYQFGYLINEGRPALRFCQEVLDLMHEVQSEL